MDALTAALGFIGGGAAVGGLLWVRSIVKPKRQEDEANQGQPTPPARSPQMLHEIASDQRELLRLKAIEEGKVIGRDEARRELEKLQSVQSELVAQKAYSDGYKKGRDDGLASYVIDIQPFYKQKGILAVGYKKYEYTFGYNYQLFVNGMPCFDPFERVIKTETDTQIDADELEKRVQGLMKSLVSGATDGVVGAATEMAGAASNLINNMRVGKLIEKK